MLFIKALQEKSLERKKKIIAYIINAIKKALLEKKRSKLLK